MACIGRHRRQSLVGPPELSRPKAFRLSEADNSKRTDRNGPLGPPAAGEVVSSPFAGACNPRVALHALPLPPGTITDGLRRIEPMFEAVYQALVERQATAGLRVILPGVVEVVGSQFDNRAVAGSLCSGAARPLANAELLPLLG